MAKQIRETLINNISWDLVSLGLTGFNIIVPITGRAHIHGVFVTQKSGNLDGFTVRLLSCRGALPASGGSGVVGAVNYWPISVSNLAPYAQVDPTPPTTSYTSDIFIVIPDIVVTSTNADGSFRDSVGVPYVNNGITTRIRPDEIYAVLTPVSPDPAKGWDFRIVYSEADA